MSLALLLFIGFAITPRLRDTIFFCVSICRAFVSTKHDKTFISTSDFCLLIPNF